MTIDEAMKKIKEKMACDYNISGCDTCEISSCEDRDIIIQLAEWLEKLKTVENIMLIYNANWYADEDGGVPDCEVLESIWNVIQDNGLDIDIEQDYRKGKSDGYNKAIYDFVENISLEISESLIWGMIADCFKYKNMNDTSDKIVDYVINTANEIAEQLKAGANNGTDNQ